MCASWKTTTPYGVVFVSVLGKGTLGPFLFYFIFVLFILLGRIDDLHCSYAAIVTYMQLHYQVPQSFLPPSPKSFA